MIRITFALLLFMVFSASSVLASSSFYSLRPVDEQAVYVLPEQFGVRGDGIADDTAGIQKAIDSCRRRIGKE
jgi:polygalacturonase